jgi:hypothetical protein
MSALPPKADIDGRCLDVRFVPKADIPRCGEDWIFNHLVGEQLDQTGTTTRPSVRAVCRLDGKLKIGCDCKIGRSAGFARYLPNVFPFYELQRLITLL